MGSNKVKNRIWKHIIMERRSATVYAKKLNRICNIYNKKLDKFQRNVRALERFFLGK